MKDKLKYFILNKDADFSRGICEKMHPLENKLEFFSDNSDSGSGVGRFMTRIFDGGEREAGWHRLLISAENCSRGDFRVTVYSTDHEYFRYGDREFKIHEVFGDTLLSLDKKSEIFEQFTIKKKAGATDILLHDVNARYIWFLIEVYSRSEKPASISEIRLYLPAVSWIDELPSIYRKSDTETHFLERYLAIFQTFFEELDERLRTITECFDPENSEFADGEFLEFIAGWLDTFDPSLWSEEKLRIFLLSAVRLYRQRGTRAGLSEILKLYTGEEPYIVENFELLKFKGTDLYTNTLLPMYGDDPYCVTVLMKSELFKLESEFSAAKKIAAEMIPASIYPNFVLLEPYIFLNRFSYIGINSVLGNYKPAVLDGRSAMTLSALI